MKTIMKLSTLILFSIIFFSAEAQKITSENREFSDSEFLEMKQFTNDKPSQTKGKSDKNSDKDQKENQRIAYDAYGNVIWLPNSADYGSPINNYGNPYAGPNNIPSSSYGNGYSYCGPQSSSSIYNSYGNSGWYTPFNTNYNYGGWNNFSNNGLPNFYNQYNQPFDWNVTTGDYGLEIPRTGVWLDSVLGTSTEVLGTQGQKIYLHEDGFFFRRWTAYDGHHNWGEKLVVDAPVGTSVRHLPRIARKAYANGQEYYIANKVVFQKQHNRRYQIVGVLG